MRQRYIYNETTQQFEPVVASSKADPPKSDEQRERELDELKLTHPGQYL